MNTKLFKMDELLNEHDFLLTNIINLDMVCILCKKILTNPRVGPCGCRYCELCIENYLKNDENICPGSTDECKEEHLNLIENINIDHFINRKIAKLKLNCPIESCTHSDQIINMKQHLIICRENAIKCPLFENGCNFISLSGENVDKHCKMSKDQHLELVLINIERVKNINNLLNKNKIELQKENEKLKTESVNDKYKLKQNETNINQLKIDYNNLKAKNEIQTKEIADYKIKYENEIKDKNNLMKYFSEFFTENQTEFVWAIKKSFSQIIKTNETIYSEEFYIYKKDIWMQLSLYHDIHFGECKLAVSISNSKKSLNSGCPFTCDITLGYFYTFSANFFSSCKEVKKFETDGISLEYTLYDSQIRNFLQGDSLTVKCVIKISVHSTI